MSLSAVKTLKKKKQLKRWMEKVRERSVSHI